jgi:two-component system, chemotaxis family, chemotaxis protein CheY
MEPTIMIVDDSTSLRKMVAFTLENAGYSVIEAENGEDALEKLAGSPVNMFIVDLNMPRLNGFELTRSVRAMNEYRFTPIVMLTTESQESKKNEAKAAGATGWITKPFKPDQLIGVIKKVMPAN